MLDYTPGATVYFKFATVRPSTGAPHALSGGTISVYKDASTTQTTTGVTLTADFDSVTGLNHVAIDTSADGTFYAAGSNFQAVITAGTVDSVSVVGQVVGEFSLSKTALASIKSKTDNLPSDPADASDIASAFSTVNSTLSTMAGYIDTEVAAIKAKTDNLPSDPASASTIATSFGTVNSTLTTMSEYIDTEIAAIKAKTDNLPSDPADQSLIEAAITSAVASLATSSSIAALSTKIDTVDDYVDTEIAAIKVVTDRLSGMLVQDGLVYQYTANALELAPSGGSGATTNVIVHPGYASRPEKVAGTTINLYHNEAGTIGPIRVQSRQNDTYTDIDLTTYTGLHVVIKDYEMTELLDTASVTISGTEDSQFSFPVTTTVTGTLTQDTEEEWHYYSLRDEDDVVICTGRLRVLGG